MSFDKIAVLDFGGQYAHLIATKIRHLEVLGEICDPLAPLEELRQYRGIILSGSPAFASGDSDEFTKEIFDLDIPILGFCFGHQEIAKRYGGKVEYAHREYGAAELHVVADSPIFKGLDKVETVWMSHGDTVTKLPAGFDELGYSTTGSDGDRKHSFAAIGSTALKRYGFQFHPEVDDTVNGSRMLANFVLDICGCKPEWTTPRYLEEIQEQIRETVGDRHVLLLISGGVDSTVTAKLLVMALGTERLHFVHVDNGLMRKNESETVMSELGELGLGAGLHLVDASSEFVSALAKAVEPEEKRRIIGDTFIEVTNRQAAGLDLENFVLGQGTIYPDRIETGGSKRAHVIKTHHNRVPIIEQMIEEGRVVEPLADLYKVEVRSLGEKLGIRAEALERHPFPGPGLGIRVLCSSGADSSDTADARDQLTKTVAGTAWKGSILPIKSVGVKGDLRSYEHAVLLTGSVDHRTDLEATAARIYKEVPGINRCALNLVSQPIDSLEAVAATVTKDRLDLLREIDAFVMEGLRRHDLMKVIWQFPTVLAPVRVNGNGRELVILRPVASERGMTARPAALPRKFEQEIIEYATGFAEVSGVVVDLTTKPPGTIEWE